MESHGLEDFMGRYLASWSTMHHFLDPGSKQSPAEFLKPLYLGQSGSVREHWSTSWAPAQNRAGTRVRCNSTADAKRISSCTEAQTSTQRFTLEETGEQAEVMTTLEVMTTAPEWASLGSHCDISRPGRVATKNRTAVQVAGEGGLYQGSVWKQQGRVWRMVLTARSMAGSKEARPPRTDAEDLWSKSL